MKPKSLNLKSELKLRKLVLMKLLTKLRKLVLMKLLTKLRKPLQLNKKLPLNLLLKKLNLVQ